MILEILGWSGSLLLLAAYALNSFRLLDSDSYFFFGMNATAGVLLIYYSLHKDAAANVFINSVWVIIALIGLGKRFVTRFQSPRRRLPDDPRK